MKFDYSQIPTHRKSVPVIILVDVSISMEGAGIAAANEGLRTFIDELKDDDALSDSVYISVITFSDEAKTIIDYQPVANINPPVLDVESSTLLDRGLQEVMNLVQRHDDDLRDSVEPLFCLITDGNPSTDDWRSKLDEMNEALYIGKSGRNRKSSFRLICGAGDGIDNDVLEAFINDKEKSRILKIEDVTHLQQFFKFLKTVTQRVSVGEPLPEKRETSSNGNISLVWDGNE